MLRWITGAAAASALSGCLVYKAVSVPVKLAVTTAGVAADTAGAVVTTTGKLTVSAIRAAGDLGSGGIEAAAKLGQAGMVTFVDPARGTVSRLPWQTGLTLAGASSMAKIEAGRLALDVVRAGKLVHSTNQITTDTAPLASGDVVRIRR